jgi:hypothetical protein
VIGNDPARLELYGPGEIVSGHEFYDYAAKYTAGLSETSTRAELTDVQRATILKIARDAYRAVGAEGFARVDFLLAGESIYLSEINTIPGFTPISLFPTRRPKAAAVRRVQPDGSWPGAMLPAGHRPRGRAADTGGPAARTAASTGPAARPIRRRRFNRRLRPARPFLAEGSMASCLVGVRGHPAPGRRGLYGRRRGREAVAGPGFEPLPLVDGAFAAGARGAAGGRLATVSEPTRSPSV